MFGLCRVQTVDYPAHDRTYDIVCSDMLYIILQNITCQAIILMLR